MKDELKVTFEVVLDTPRDISCSKTVALWISEPFNKEDMWNGNHPKFDKAMETITEICGWCVLEMNVIGIAKR